MQLEQNRWPLYKIAKLIESECAQREPLVTQKL
jgi:hypothetical protein